MLGRRSSLVWMVPAGPLGYWGTREGGPAKRNRRAHPAESGWDQVGAATVSGAIPAMVLQTGSMGPSRHGWEDGSPATSGQVASSYAKPWGQQPLKYLSPRPTPNQGRSEAVAAQLRCPKGPAGSRSDPFAGYDSCAPQNYQRPPPSCYPIRPVYAVTHRRGPARAMTNGVTLTPLCRAS